MIIKQNKLGTGGFGEVWEATMNHHTSIAMKNLLDKKGEEGKIKIMHEVEIMEKVHHPKLINFYGFWKDQGNITSYIIDLLPGGDLDNLLHSKKRPKTPSMQERFIILKNIAVGIQAFHSKNIVHRDIKAGNVLFPDVIKQEGNILSAKLADYGESIDLNSDKMCYIRKNKDKIEEDLCFDPDYCGTPQYAPKEILQGDLRSLCLKSDIYSFGILMWEIFTEKRPFDNIDTLEIMDRAYDEEILKPFTKKLANGKDQLIPYVEDTPKEINDLIRKCVSDEIENRPIIHDVIDSIIEIEKNNNLINLHTNVLDNIEKKLTFTGNLYIPPEGSLEKNSEKTFDLLENIKENFLNKNNKNSEENLLIILGATGSGKSLFTKSLQNYLTKEEKKFYAFRFDLTNYNIKTDNESDNNNNNNNKESERESLLKQVMNQYNISETFYSCENFKKKIIFIFDGLSEIRYNKDNNNNNINLFSEIKNFFPEAKIIITCRNEFFSDKKNTELISDLFNIYITKENNKLFSRKFNNKIFLRNFSQKQVETFISFYVDINKNKNFIKNFLEKLNKNPYYKREANKVKKCFMDMISTIGEYLPIINTPFVLKTFCALIPENENFQDKEKLKTLNRNTITEMFIYSLYEKEYITFVKNTKVNNISFKGLLVKDKIEEMINFLDIFSYVNFMQNFNNLNGKIYIDKDSNFMEYFFLEDIKTEFFRKTAENLLLQQYLPGKWGFKHKSFLDYFVAKRFVKEILKCKKVHFFDDNNNNNENNNCDYEIREMLINKIPLLEYQNILIFLVDYLKTNKDFEKNLWDCVYYKRNKNNKNKNDTNFHKDSLNELNSLNSDKNNNSNFTEFHLMSANALTILNYGNTPLFNLNLSNLNLQNADLSNSTISNCNFRNSNMENCNLNNTLISNCDFTNTNLKKILTNSSNRSDFLSKNLNSAHEEIKSFAISPNEKIFALLSHKKKHNIDYILFFNSADFNFIKKFSYSEDNNNNNNNNNENENFDQIQKIFFSNSGKFFITKGEEFIKIYEVDYANKFKIKNIFEQKFEEKINLQNFGFSFDEKFFAVKLKNQICIYLTNTNTNTNENFEKIFKKKINFFKFSNNTDMIFTLRKSSEGNFFRNFLEIIDLKNFEVIKEITLEKISEKENENEIKNISISQNDKFFIFEYLRIYKIFSLEFDFNLENKFVAFNFLGDIEKNHNLNSDLIISPNSKYLIKYEFDLQENFKEIKKISGFYLYENLREKKIKDLTDTNTNTNNDNDNDNFDFDFDSFQFSSKGNYLIGIRDNKITLMNPEENFSKINDFNLPFNAIGNGNVNVNFNSEEFNEFIKFDKNEEFLFLVKKDYLNLFAFKFNEYLNYDEDKEIAYARLFDAEKKRMPKFISNLSCNNFNVNNCIFDNALFDEDCKFKENCEKSAKLNNLLTFFVKPLIKSVKEENNNTKEIHTEIVIDYKYEYVKEVYNENQRKVNIDVKYETFTYKNDTSDTNSKIRYYDCLEHITEFDKENYNAISEDIVNNSSDYKSRVKRSIFKKTEFNEENHTQNNEENQREY